MVLCPEAITGDSLWKMQAYRLAMFAADVGWEDVTRLLRDRRTVSLANQLYRSLGSIGANLAEAAKRPEAQDPTMRGSTSMRWAPHAKAVIGTTRDATYWAKK